MKKIYTILLLLLSTTLFSQEGENSEAPKTIPLNTIEKVPVYLGCEEESSNKELKKCMSYKLAAFVQKKFNTRIASYLKPSVEKVKITVLFKIDENGKIGNILARGPHPKLEKEAIRVVESIPDMTKPGMQDGKPAVVPYMLPIKFVAKNKTMIFEN
jgi:protein TonB